MPEKSAIADARLLVSGYKLMAVGKRRKGHIYDDVGHLRLLCGHVRDRIAATHPDFHWHDRYTWFLIRDVLAAVDDGIVSGVVDESTYLVVAKHMLACGGPYHDHYPVPGVTADGQPVRLSVFRDAFGPTASFEHTIALRRRFCAKILGVDSKIFGRDEPHRGSAARALLKAVGDAINIEGYVAARIDDYSERLNRELLASPPADRYAITTSSLLPTETEYDSAAVDRKGDTEKRRRQKRVLDGAGLYATLRNLYPHYEMVRLWGVTMPICAFPAEPCQSDDFETALARLESALGDPPAGLLPSRLEYPTGEYDPKGRKRFDEVLDRFVRATPEEKQQLFPGPTYSVDKIHLPHFGSPLRIDCKLGRFFTKEATSEDLDAEMMSALAHDPDSPVTLDDDRLPMRRWLHDRVDDPVIDGSRRDGAVSHATAIMMATNSGTYDLFLARRTGNVATHPYFSHVCPSGIFSPYSEDPRPDEAEFSVLRNFQREFSEEMYDKAEQQLPTNHWDEVPEPAREPEVERLMKLIEDRRAALTYTGVSVNLLTLRPEICLLLRVDDPDWDKRERAMKPPDRPLKLNWEYLQGPADEVIISRDQPTHWRVPLNEDLRPKNTDLVFAASWTVPNAAAAIKLAIDAMQRRLA